MDEPGLYKWLIVLGSFYNHVCCMGIPYASGVFIVHFIEEFESSGLGGISFIPTLLPATVCLMGPISSALMKKLGYRATTMTGGFLSSLGFLLSSLAFTVPQYCVTFTITGIGFGLGILPSTAIIHHYFENKKPLAMGLAVTGTGVGISLFPLIQYFLSHEYGWQSHFIILAGIPLQMCITGAMFKPPAHHTQTRSLRMTGVWSVSFVLFFIYNITSMFGSIMYYIHLPAYLEGIGHSEEIISGIISTMGTVQLIVRPLNAIIFQKVKSNFATAIVIGTIGGIAMIITPFLTSTLYVTIAAVILGLSNSGFSLIFGLIVTDIVAKEYIGDALGLGLVADGIGSLIGPIFAGYLHDIAQNYTLSMCVGGIVYILGSWLMLHGLPWRIQLPQPSIQIQVNEPYLALEQ